MYYDLNVPWTSNHVELQRTLAFLAELDYNVVALNHTLSGKLPADLTSPIPYMLPFPTPPTLTTITRCTVIIADPSQNHRLAGLLAAYDLLALRPTTEKTLLYACQAQDCDLISLDLSVRLPFHFRAKTLSLALSRGIAFEISYAAGTLGGVDARRNLIGNATALIRATRGRGIVLSSEAARALQCRGPADVVNLGAVWGLGQERGVEAVGRGARAVVVQAGAKRTAWRGVVDVLVGGEAPVKKAGDGERGLGKGKRKVGVMETQEGKDEEEADRMDKAEEKPISKREMKRREKKARLGAARADTMSTLSVSVQGTATVPGNGA